MVVAKIMIQQGVLTISKIFNLKTEEWPSVLLLFLIAVLSNAGFTFGSIISYARFLQQDQSNIESLPILIILISTLSVVATVVYTPFVDRIANDRLHIIIFAIEAAGIVLGLILIQLEKPFAFPFLYLLVYATIAVINPHQITYFNSFYNTQAAKRTLPVVTAGYRVGGILAGAALSRLTEPVPGQIISAWLLLHLGIIVITWRLPPLLRKFSSQAPPADSMSVATMIRTETERTSYLENIVEGFRYTVRTNFLRWMAIGTFLLMTIIALLWYRSTEEILLQLNARSSDEAAFTRLLSHLTIIGNLISLPMLFFGMSRIIARLGLSNASLIYPMGNIFVCSGLIFSPGLITASIAHLYRQDFQISIQFPITSLLYNAVPLRVKGRARAFVTGLISPAGLLAGGILLLLSTVLNLAFIPALVGLLAVVYLGSTFVIRKLYRQALITLLKQEDFSFLLSQEVSDLSEVDPATLTILKQRLMESTDPKFTIFIAQLIAQLGGQAAIPILSDVAKQTSTPEIRTKLIDVLVTADLQGDEIHKFYSDFLNDPDRQVRLAAIRGLEQLVGPDHEDFLTPALQMLDDHDVEARTQTLLALANCKDFYAIPAAVECLNQLLSQADSPQRVYGVQVLAKIADIRTHRSTANVTRPVYHLTTWLKDPDDEVRLHAAQGIETISKNKITSELADIILQQMSSLIDDPVERIRQATLVVYGRLGQKESHPILLKALKDSSSRIRTAAVDTIVEVRDKTIIPMIKEQLDSPDPQLRKMATIALSRINPNEFGELTESHVADDLFIVYRNFGLIEALATCSEFQSITVLQSTLREQNQALVDEIFQLLAAVHGRRTIDVVTTTLESSDERIRANAAEALEALISPQTAQLIVPLFDPNMTTAQLANFSRQIQGIDQPDTVQAIRQIISDSHTLWPRVIMTYSLGEMGVSLSQNGAGEDDDSSEQERRSRRIPSDDPLAVLTNSGNRDKKKKRRVRPTNLLNLLTDSDQDSTVQAEEPPKEADQAAHRFVPLTLPEIQTLLSTLAADPAVEVLSAANSAKRMLGGFNIVEEAKKEDVLLSTIERIIFLKQVAFFKGMNIHQLEVLAKICEEKLFEEDQWIFHEGDPGGALYVIVSGRIGIEQEKRKGSYARLATLGAHDYFGEMTLFDNGPRSASALALQDTLTLRLRREPLIALARQYPDLSLELIQILNERLRQANQRIAELTRARPRELQKLFDKLD